MTQTVHPLFEKGVSALGAGRMAEAQSQFEGVLKSEPDNAAALFNLGLIHFQKDNATEAEACLSKAHGLRPDHPDTQAVLAAVLVQTGKPAEAVELARGLVVSNPNAANVLHSAGQVLAAAGWTDEAEAAHHQALQKDPSYRPAALALTNLLLARRAFSQAASVCDTALRASPTDQDFHLKRAQALWEGGQTAAARDALRNVLDFVPDNVTAHYNLSLFADHEDAQTAIDRLVVLLSENTLNDEDKTKAWFALGNLFASQSRHEQSLACFKVGNDARAAQATTAHGLSADAFQIRVRELQSKPLPPYAPQVSPGPTPLIIAGPSRSGKSLLQSWLCGHPEICAADETGVLPHLAESEAMSDPANLADAAAAYRQALTKLGGSCRFVVDTHPVNVLYLDLLHQICPDAVIIQISRNPLDLAVSTYARHFVTGGHWADSWSGIARRIAGYDRLRDHWSAWGPVKATVAYETLVQDPSQTLRHVVKALDLPWTDEVLPPEHHSKSLRPMPWASFADRAGVATDSIGLWRPFAPWLGEFVLAYGSDSAAAAEDIPQEAVQPENPWAEGLKSLAGGGPEADDLPDGLMTLPVIQARLADHAEEKKDWQSALTHRWQAVDHRPFTHNVRHHAERLYSMVDKSPHHQALSHLHRSINTAWSDYRQASGLRFGDFGLLYQSCAEAYLPGSRCTTTRANAYGLADLVVDRTVLDLGCNVGFLSLAAATSASHVHGVEKHSALVDIAQQTAAHLHRSNTQFTTADLADFAPHTPCDVVIAAAVHGWLDQPLDFFIDLLVRCTASNGAILFESQGRRSTLQIEDGFTEAVETIAKAGFKIEKEGQVCDDRVNLRAFAVLRKVG